MWKCVDVVSFPGGPGADYSEDLLGMGGSLAWVIDGASPVTKTRVTTDENSDAYWLAHRLDEALKALALETGLSLAQIVSQAIALTAERARREWVAQPDVPPSAALGVIRSDGLSTEYLVLADISVIFKTAAEVHEITDRRVAECNKTARRTMKALLGEGKDFAEARRETIPLLAEARSAMNREGGYWVASLDEGAVEHALQGHVDGVQEVVLASDGFMRIVRTFGLIGVDDLFAPDCSLRDLAEQVRAAERDDPETRRFARWSVSDDLCAKRLRWVD
jgi:hypothetical protein